MEGGVGNDRGIASPVKSRTEEQFEKGEECNEMSTVSAYGIQVLLYFQVMFLYDLEFRCRVF